MGLASPWPSSRPDTEVSELPVPASSPRRAPDQAQVVLADAELAIVAGCTTVAMVPISCRNRWTGPVSPLMSMPVSDPAKMRAVRAWVVAVIVTSAALGHLPALFALPAGLGDIAAGIAAPLAAHRLAQGTGRRVALWFNAFGMTNLVNALTLGALTGFQLINVTPSGAPISELPLALIPTAAVPLLFALHITSVSALVRAPRKPRPATAPLTAAAS